MKEVFDEVIRTTLVEVGARFRDFVPNLLAALALLAVGILAAVAIRYAVGLVLRWLAFDRDDDAVISLFYDLDGEGAGGVRRFREADDARRHEVLRAHPDLAGKLAAAKRLTEASTAEQASAGLDALTLALAGGAPFRGVAQCHDRKVIYRSH